MSRLTQVIPSYPYMVVAGCCVGLVFCAYRWYISGRRCTSKTQLQGKMVIITGANTGIGKETAIDLAKRKARVILACRSDERGEQAAAEIRRMTKNDDVVYRHLDLASLASVRQFCNRINREEACVDVLINNAGLCLMQLTKTADHHETTFAVNHLGHFLLTLLLLDKLKAAESGRIIIVTGKLYKLYKGLIDFENLNAEKSFSPLKTYAQSKLANILFTRYLARKLQDEGSSNVTVNCLHPGAIDTEFSRFISSSGPLKVLVSILSRMLLRTPHQGAQTTIHCAVASELEGVSGQYFEDCRIGQLKDSAALDDKAAELLWKESEKMVGLAT